MTLHNPFGVLGNHAGCAGGNGSAQAPPSATAVPLCAEPRSPPPAGAPGPGEGCTSSTTLQPSAALPGEFSGSGAGAGAGAGSATRSVTGSVAGSGAGVLAIDAARAVLTLLAKPLERYLRLVRRAPAPAPGQAAGSAELLHARLAHHLAFCLERDLGHRVFLERLLTPRTPTLRSFTSVLFSSVQHNGQ